MYGPSVLTLYSERSRADTLSRINVSCFAIAGPTRSSRNCKFSAFILNIDRNSDSSSIWTSQTRVLLMLRSYRRVIHFLIQRERFRLRLAWDNRHNLEVSTNSFFLRRFSLRPITNTCCQFIFTYLRDMLRHEELLGTYGWYLRAVRLRRTYGHHYWRPYGSSAPALSPA